MAEFIRSGINWIESKIPSRIQNRLPTVGINRDLLYLAIFLGFSQKRDRGREDATLATLSLKGRLSDVNDPFIKWTKSNTGKLNSSLLNKNLRIFLIKSQVRDLICKVIVSTAFYCTKELSLYSAFIRIISCSEKVSKIAQPILDSIANLPKPRFLQATRIIIFAPVILKLLHMTLLCFDPKDEWQVLKMLKTSVNKTSQGLEFLWNLRFSLICLGISKSVFNSVFSMIYLEGVNYFFTKEVIDKIISNLAPDSIKMDLTKDPILRFCTNIGLNSILRLPLQLYQFVKGSDTMPLIGFMTGVSGMLTNIKTRSDSSDIPTLEGLFQSANGLKFIKNLDIFLERVMETTADISSALRERKITEVDAKRLYQMVEKKKQEALITLCRDPELKSKLLEENFSSSLIELFMPNATVIKQNNFVELLKLFNTVFKAQDNIAFQNSLAGVSFFLSVHKEELEISDVLFPEEKAKETSYKDALYSEILKEAFTRYPEDFKETDLLNTNYERNLAGTYGKEGLIHTLSEEENIEAAQLLTMKFYHRRFEVNLEWYLNNQPQDSNQRETCELLLLFLAEEAQLDIQSIKSTKGFKEWSRQNNFSQDIQEYVQGSESFNFARNAVTIPKEFKFETYYLPFICREKRKFVKATEDSWPQAGNFQDSFSKNWIDPIFMQKEAESEATKAKELVALGGRANISFISSQAIRDAAKPASDTKKAAPIEEASALVIVE